MQIIYISLLMISLIFSSSSNFSIKEKNGLEDIIEFNIGQISIDNNEDGYHSITSESKGTTRNVGQPELPTYTFNYAVDYNLDYNVSINENDYIIYNDIDLSPTQPFYQVDQEKTFIKDAPFYSKNTIYPDSKVNSKRSTLRGYDLLSIELTPYEYNPQTKQLKVFNNLDVIITQSDQRQNINRAPRSQMFESMYKNSVINSEDIKNIYYAFMINIIYLSVAVSLFYYSFNQARKKGTLINIGE